MKGNEIRFREMKKGDLPFFKEVRNSCASEYLHNPRMFTRLETEKWFKGLPQTKKYYIISLYEDETREDIGYFRTEIIRGIYGGGWGHMEIGADLKESARGKGYAKKAYQSFMPWAKMSLRVCQFSLEILAANTRAYNLYRSLGFKVSQDHGVAEVERNGRYYLSVTMDI